MIFIKKHQDQQALIVYINNTRITWRAINIKAEVSKLL